MKSLFCTTLCALLYFLCTYVALLPGERQRWRVWLGNQNTRGFGRQARQDKPPYELPLVPPRGLPPLFPVNPFLPLLPGRRKNFVFAAANKFLICCSLVSYLLFLSLLKLSLRSTFVSPQALSRCTALRCNKETLKKEKAFLSCAVVQLLCIALQLMLCIALHCFALLCMPRPAAAIWPPQHAPGLHSARCFCSPLFTRKNFFCKILFYSQYFQIDSFFSFMIAKQAI